MTSSDRGRRLARLEHRRTPCPRCAGWPVRVVIEDLATGHTEENFPRPGCPACGTPIGQTVIISGDPGDDQKGWDSRRWS